MMSAIGLLPAHEVPGSKEFRPDGYRLEEIGPEALRNTGHEKIRVEAERMHGCPFAGPLAMRK